MTKTSRSSRETVFRPNNSYFCSRKVLKVPHKNASVLLKTSLTILTMRWAGSIPTSSCSVEMKQSLSRGKMLNLIATC